MWSFKRQQNIYSTHMWDSQPELGPDSGHHAGAQIPLEDVPSVQKEVVVRCRQQGKPVIVASHLLQSMLEFPTPTRAEV